MDSTTHKALEARVVEKATNAEHNEERRTSTSSMKKNLDHTNISMVSPEKSHFEIANEDSGKSIDDIAPGWFVWLVALTASIAGSLFGEWTEIHAWRLVIV